MFAFSDQLVAFQRQSLESSQAIAMASVAGFEKLAQLNIQAARASVEESVQKGISLLESRDVKALTETSSESPQSASDKFTAYAKHVFEIASETSAEISKIVEKQFSESNRQVAASIEALAKNSPAGSEGVETLVRSGVSVANATWDQVNKVNRQVVDVTEANVANATNAAGTAARRKTA